MSSAIKTPAFAAKASNILNEDNSSIYSGGEWSFKNASAVTGFHVASDGNVGIGTTSPTDSASFGQTLDVVGGAGSGAAVYIRAQASATNYLSLGQGNNGTSYIINRENAPMLFYTNNTERMRIDASGRLIVRYGADINVPSGQTWTVASTGASQTFCTFRDGNSVPRGSIVVNPSAGTTSFNTSSDYRLKEDIIPMTDALQRISLLKPVYYKWKHSGAESEGFIAHELAEVCPLAVSGEKDAINEDGSINPQGIDPSKLIGLLTAAIQELSAKVDAQAEEIKALKAQP